MLDEKNYSEQTAVEIDREVKGIVMTNYDKAKALLIERIGILHALAKALLETESLDGLQIDAIVNGAAAPAPVPA